MCIIRTRTETLYISRYRHVPIAHSHIYTHSRYVRICTHPHPHERCRARDVSFLPASHKHVLTHATCTLALADARGCAPPPMAFAVAGGQPSRPARAWPACSPGARRAGHWRATEIARPSRRPDAKTRPERQSPRRARAGLTPAGAPAGARGLLTWRKAPSKS